MAKSLILMTADGTRVPFLRGILTRSLQAAGLPFDEAYATASAVRDELRDEAEITTRDLEKRVRRHLAAFGEEVDFRYRTRRAVLPPILVQHADGHEAPFSRGRHRLALSPCGISGEAAAHVVEQLLGRLAAEGISTIPAHELDRMTYGLLKEQVGAEPARRFAVWKEFQQSDTPLIVLIGGATGVGKSTIAAQVCNRLEIVRAQSTDMLREVMRMMVPERLLPVLYASSFLAWQALPQRERPDAGGDDLEAGYLAQVELIGVACEAVFQRAEQERVSLIMEGVHVHPSLLERVPGSAEAIVVPAMLGVLKPKRLRQQIKGRGLKIPGRRAKRYLEHFDAIWRLQTYLLSEADRAGIPIVTSTEVDETVDLVVGLIIDELSRTFTGKPSTVFR